MVEILPFPLIYIFIPSFVLISGNLWSFYQKIEFKNHLCIELLFVDQILLQLSIQEFSLHF